MEEDRTWREPSKVFWRLSIESSCLRENPVRSIASSFVNHRLRSSSQFSQIPAWSKAKFQIQPPVFRMHPLAAHYARLGRLRILEGAPGVRSPSHLQSRVLSCAAFHGQRFAVACNCVASAIFKFECGSVDFHLTFKFRT